IHTEGGPIPILDFKGDFVDVPSRLGKDIWKHYSATDGFRIGIGPPSVCIENVSWINQFTKLIAAHCDLKFSEATLAAVIRIAFNLLNYPFTGTIIWPSLPLIEQLLKEVPWYLIARKQEYWRTALHKIEHLNSISDNLFRAEQGFDLYEHLITPRSCAVIDCTSLSPLLREVLVNLICLLIVFARLTLRQTSKKTNLALIIDEVDPILSYEVCRKYPEGYNPLGGYIKCIREFGGFGAFGVSFLGHCDRFITSNIANPIIMNQTDPNSIDEAARILLEPQSRSLIASLTEGQFIAKEAMGPVPYAMLVKADYVEPATILRPDKFDTHPFTPARGIDEIPGFRDRLNQFLKESKAVSLKSGTVKSPKETLSKKGRTFLKLMSLHEYEPLNRIFDKMEIYSSGVQKQIIKTLVEQKYIEVVTFRSESSWYRLGRLIDKGWKFNNDRSKYPSTRGDLIHTTVCYSIMFLGKKLGYQESVCEKKLSGTTGFCDGLHRINGQLHIYEVVIECFGNVTKHARTALIECSEPVVSLTFVTAHKSDHKKIQHLILADSELTFCISNIRFTTAAQIWKELWS
ncbi:hypothetical protein ACFL3Q_13285, partial [Planctomycetota bacterium]